MNEPFSVYPQKLSFIWQKDILSCKLWSWGSNQRFSGWKCAFSRLSCRIIPQKPAWRTKFSFYFNGSHITFVIPNICTVPLEPAYLQQVGQILTETSGKHLQVWSSCRKHDDIYTHLREIMLSMHLYSSTDLHFISLGLSFYLMNEQQDCSQITVCSSRQQEKKQTTFSSLHNLVFQRDVSLFSQTLFPDARKNESVTFPNRRVISHKSDVYKEDKYLCQAESVRREGPEASYSTSNIQTFSSNESEHQLSGKSEEW